MKHSSKKLLTTLILSGIMAAGTATSAFADTAYNGHSSYQELLQTNPQLAPQKVVTVYWEGSMARWSAAGNSLQYEIEIYHNDTLFVNTVVTGTEYNMASASYPSGTYKFRVRGVGTQAVTGPWSAYTPERYLGGYNKTTSSSKSSYSTSVTTRYVQNGMGTPGWNHDYNGYWYCNSNMTYPANTWMEIDGVYYYFDNNGYMKTGWVEGDNGEWYYTSSNGALSTGYQTIDGQLYYFDTATGKMLANTYTPDGRYVDINGICR